MAQTKGATLIGIVATLLAALSLRIPTISLGPLLPDIRTTTGYGETLLSLLTSVPLAMTLVIAPVAPWIATQLGRNRVISLALIAIAAGTSIRSLPGDAALITGTLLLGLGIAVGTVLLPAAISAETSSLRARLTGTYSMALSLGPALALGLTIPIMHTTGLGWRGTLAIWSSCTVLALLCWLLHTGINLWAPTTTAQPEPAPKTSGIRTAVTDFRVWQIALYLGITSITFYTTSTWLPTTLVMDGMSPGAAGSYAAIINIVAIPFAFIAPLIIRRGYARVLAPLAPVGAILGVVVLLSTGTAQVLVSVLLFGISQGLCLGVSYDQVVRYASSPKHAASVSAITQAFGVALAAIGPFAYGAGLEATASATISLIGLGLVVVLQMLLGLRTGTFIAQRQ
ncbi:MAG TPA: MFS transporter [Candidatus Yaniella excrementigallinarum]|nr:MFS transporter [Candidatus Yaniella excrementigallinarum]